LIDKPVRMGDTITQQMADDLLLNEVEHLFAPGLFTLLPMAKQWRPNQIAALISWAYNVGLGAAEESTLRKRLMAGEDRAKVVIEELPRWNKADGKVLEGLVSRRKDEVRLFTGGQPLQQESLRGNPINAPWFSQLDSATDQARRMCFSSSCAMLLATLKPDSIVGWNADDQYLKRVQQYGDTTDPAAQVKALASYGVKARFTQTASFKTIEQQIDRGIPVPCGYLHRGPVTAPSGGGHWLCVVGYSATHMVVHDPLGESDLITGATLNTTARFARYTRKNWAPRWMVEGDGTGWAIIAE
jgi:GH24 family phage-related lysozyme (muramidase)